MDIDVNEDMDIDVEKELNLPPYNPSPINTMQPPTNMPPIPTVMPSNLMTKPSPSSAENYPPVSPSLTSSTIVGIDKPLGESVRNSLTASKVVTNSVNPYSQMDNKTRKTTICNCVNELNNLLMSLSVGTYYF